MALGYYDTPGGRILLDDQEAVSFGLGPPPSLEPGPGASVQPPPAPSIDAFQTPTLPPPTESAAPPSGIVDPFPAPPAVPPALAPVADVVVGAAKGAGKAVGAAARDIAAPAAPQLPAPAKPAPAPNLSKTGYGDVLAEQDRAAGAQVDAGAQIAESEAKKLDEQALAQQARNAEIAAKEQEFAAREQADQENIAKTTSLYESKVKEFADKKIDRSLGLSTGRSVLLGISVALAGLGSALKGQGDKNPALDIVMKAINEHVEDQWRAKEAIKDAAGMARDQLGIFQDAAKNTQAQKQLAIAGLLEKHAREWEATASRMDAGIKRDSVAKLAADAWAERGNRLATAVQLQHADDKAAAQLAQQERESRRSAGVAYAGIAQREKESLRNFEEGKRQFDANQALQWQNALNQANQLRAAGDKAGAEAMEKKVKEERELGVGGAPQLVKDEKGNPTGVEFRPLTNKDGTQFLAPDSTAAREIRTQKAAVDAVAQVADDMVRLIEKHGWESDTVKGDAWRKMQADWATLVLEYKDVYKLGALAGPDVDIIAKALGTKDPTEMRNPVEGVRQARKNAFVKLNSTLRSANYTGPDYYIPEQTKAGDQDAVKNTPIEALVKATKARAGTFEATGTQQTDADAQRVGAPGSYPTEEAEAAIGQLAAKAAEGDEAAIKGLRVVAQDSSAVVRRLVTEHAYEGRVDLGLPGMTKKDYEQYDYLKTNLGDGARGYVPAPVRRWPAGGS